MLTRLRSYTTVVAGFLLGLTIVWCIDHIGLLSVGTINPKVWEKWQIKSEVKTFPKFFQKPGHPTGKHYFRRTPSTETANVLKQGAEAAGFMHHPYDNLPAITVSYGDYGFRDEYPALEGGLAIVGSSYAELGILRAEDTWPGLLKSKYEVTAANFGVGATGGYTILHYLKQYVLPTKPKRIVWIVAERQLFKEILAEENRIRTRQQPTKLLDSLPQYLKWTTKALVSDGIFRAKRLLGTSQAANHQKHDDIPTAEAVVNGEIVKVHLSSAVEKHVVEKSRPLLLKVLGAMADAAASQHASLAVLYLPSRNHVFRQITSRKMSVDGSNYAYETIAKICDQVGVPIANAGMHLTQAMRNGELVFNPVHDQHLNARGVEIATDVLVKNLLN